jgi:hypothetical protein
VVDFVRVTYMDRFDKISLRRGSWSRLFLLLFLAVSPAGGLGQIPPDEAWRTLETAHFRVTYPDGFLDLARRAGERGETAWTLLSERFVPGPKGKVDLLITDHVDDSNGFAQIFPSNRIVVYAPPPMEGFGLAHTDEWMELVVTHELVHIFHEDRARGLGGALRKVFGRVPAEWPFFPGSATPGWTVEGIATYFESALTEAGRVRGSFHEMVLRTAVLEGAFEPIDRTSGDSQSWPGGQRAYIYGSLFLHHLVEVHGEDAMGSFVEAVAGQWVPYRLNAASKSAFGVSFSDAWREWEQGLAIQYQALKDSLTARGPLTTGETLTAGGYLALNALPEPDGARVAFARYDGRSDTQLRLFDPVTGESRKMIRSNGIASFAWVPGGGLVFSQPEYADPYRVWGDLFRLGSDGIAVRITRGQRLDRPHVAPAGDKAVAVQGSGGTNRLVLVDLSDGGLHPLGEFEPQVHWGYPRWSPNGEWIAAARWTPGANYDLVLLNGEGEELHRITRDRAIDSAPTWSPDGRWLLWSSDRSGIPNLYAVEIDEVTGAPGPPLQITNVLGGAAYPAVAPGSEWIYYSGYHADGWHIERIPFHPDDWFTPFPEHATFSGEVDLGRYARTVQSPEQEYDPLPTLRPTYWAPAYRPGDDAGSVEVLKPGFGLSTSGQDLVGRHSYSLSGTFSPEPGGFQGGTSYSFAGLGNPILTASANQFLDADGPLAAPDESGDLLYLVERERGVGLSATLLRRRVRTFSSITLSGSHIWEHRTLLDAGLRETDRFRLNRPDSRLGEGRVSFSFSNARRYAFSVSPEDGIGLFLRGRIRRELSLADSLRDVPSEDRSLRDVIGRLSLYKGFRVRGFGNHVLGLRGSGGVAGGPGADAYHFEVGGASGADGPLTFVDLGQSLLFPVRGYGTARRFGRYAWSASAEYRFPIRLVNRGLGLFPLHLDWVAGTLFMDAGNAWGPELDLRGYNSPLRDPLASVGGEVIARILPLWYATWDVRVGFAVPLVEGEGGRAYLRLGPSF